MLVAWLWSHSAAEHVEVGRHYTTLCSMHSMKRYNSVSLTWTQQQRIQPQLLQAHLMVGRGSHWVALDLLSLAGPLTCPHFQGIAWSVQKDLVPAARQADTSQLMCFHQYLITTVFWHNNSEVLHRMKTEKQTMQSQKY